jgi:glycerol-3-phosphate acyltransferase PlsX
MSEATLKKGHRIALDCMGGDLGPSEAVAAAALALKDGVIGPDDTLVLVGNEDNLRLLAMEHRNLKSSRVIFKHAPSIVGPDDAPMTVLKSKRDSSMVIALELLKAGEVDAVVSTGNTKALVAAGTIKVRAMEGAERPALAAIMPRREGHFILLDVGANPEATPEHLVHNAVLGSIYAQSSLGIAHPRVGLLTVGTEEGKGGARINRTHSLLKAMGTSINYIGPVEGFDMFGDACDVVVTDGFTGNVILKTLEGLVYMLRELVGNKVMRNPVFIAGGIAMFPFVRVLNGFLKPERVGGARLLGLNGLVMKAHGSSNRQGIVSAIRLGLEALGHGARRQMQMALAEANKVISATPEEV